MDATAARVKACRGFNSTARSPSRNASCQRPWRRRTKILYVGTSELEAGDEVFEIRVIVLVFAQAGKQDIGVAGRARRLAESPEPFP